MVAFINHASYYDVFQKESQMSKPKLKKSHTPIIASKKIVKVAKSPKSLKKSEHEKLEKPMAFKTTIPVPIGMQLALEREKLNISIPDLARRMKRSTQQIYSLERSKSSPRFDTIDRYAKALGFRAVIAFVPISKS